MNVGNLVEYILVISSLMDSRLEGSLANSAKVLARHSKYLRGEN